MAGKLPLGKGTEDTCVYEAHCPPLPLPVWWVDSSGGSWARESVGSLSDSVAGRVEAMERVSWDNKQGSHDAGS